MLPCHARILPYTAMIRHCTDWVPSTTMDPADPRVYVQVARKIAARIESGEIEQGHPVPSITALVQEEGIARETAAKALKLLAEEGLVRFYPGRGYFVI
jgi:DNA-binding GntR family transcriptional regulator